MKRLLIVLMIVAAGAIGATAQGSRLGGQWDLVEINGEDVADLEAYLEFAANQKRFTGNTGCNRMFGPVGTRGQRIDFSNVGMTRMACGPDRRKQRIETALVEGLDHVERFRRTGNSLVLTGPATVMKFVLHAGKPANGIRLEDKKWTLAAIKGVPVSKLGESAFVVFDAAKGSAGGNSSCNVFGGSYTTKGDSLKITDVISTMRACIEDDRMTIEREFLDGLRSATRYEIKDGKLILYQDRRLLLTFTGEAKR